jgi:hypothetical protein
VTGVDAVPMSSGAGARLRPVSAGRSSLLLPALIVALLGLSGCGTTTDRTQVRAVTERFFSALDAHRGAEACRQLSPALRATVEQEHAMAPCPAAVVKTIARGSGVAAVFVYATSARVDLATGEGVFLGVMRRGWQIDAFGCRPRASGPYDCEEQG